eukprot:scaffold8961_cov25-Tisochrysis_lutea.AAC.1
MKHMYEKQSVQKPDKPRLLLIAHACITFLLHYQAGSHDVKYRILMGHPMGAPLLRLHSPIKEGWGGGSCIDHTYAQCSSVRGEQACGRGGKRAPM